MTVAHLKSQLTQLKLERNSFKHLFAEWHKMKRKELGYTQKELALLLIVPVQSVRKYEQGQVLPRYIDDYIRDINELRGKVK